MFTKDEHGFAGHLKWMVTTTQAFATAGHTAIGTVSWEIDGQVVAAVERTGLDRAARIALRRRARGPVLYHQCNSAASVAPAEPSS